MILRRIYNSGNESVLDSTPSTVFTYTVDSGVNLVSVKAKLLVRNIDEGATLTDYHTFSYIVNNITPAGLTFNPDTRYQDASSVNSLTTSISYTQSTGVINFIITNTGSYAPEIATTWLVELEIFTKD